MSISDTLAIWGLVLSFVGLAVTAVGFILAIKQLRKTATAAEAATAAISGANAQMVHNHLLILLPQIQTLEADLDAAIIAGEKEDAARALVSFSHAANQIAALLTSNTRPSTDASLEQELRSTAKKASELKAAIVKGSKKTLPVLLGAVAQEIGAVSARCSGLITTYQAKAG
jgi:chemotaxis protein histidine kinase CheA